MTEEYNGWSNRETWAANLWMTNDNSSYEYFANLEDYSELQELFELYYLDLDVVPAPTALTILQDVGSLWRVNWHEIAESFKLE